MDILTRPSITKQSLTRFAAALSLCLGFALFDARVACAAESNDHPTFHVAVTGHGQPMILIPGLASSGATWDSTVARYAEHYQCHVLTLSGFAGQPAVAGFSLERAVHDLSAYITAERLERPVVVGHSLGGLMALKLAAAHPDEVGSLIIVDTLPALGAVQNPSLTPDRLGANAVKMKAGLLKMSEDQRKKMAAQSISTLVTNPADVQRIYGWSETTDWPTEVTALSEIMGTDMRQEVGKIKAPALVLGTWIAYSAYATEEQVKQTFMAQYAKESNVEIDMAPKAKHFIMYDDPTWFFARMDAFLSKNAA